MDIKTLYLGAKFAFSYFSLLPVNLGDEDLNKKDILNSMLFFFPLVGIVLVFCSILPYIFFQNPLFALLGGVLYVVFTGFIHLEAVIDVADALYAKMAGKDPYKVIKEPTIGAIGALWGGSFLFLEVAGFAYLLTKMQFFSLFMIALFSRLSLLFLIYFLEFKSSFITNLKKSLKRFSLIFWSIFSLKLLIFLPISFAVSLFFKRKLGFINGDVLGASLVFIEVILYFMEACCGVL